MLFPIARATQCLGPTFTAMGGFAGAHARLEDAVGLPGAVDFVAVLLEAGGEADEIGSAGRGVCTFSSRAPDGVKHNCGLPEVRNYPLSRLKAFSRKASLATPAALTRLSAGGDCSARIVGARIGASGRECDPAEIFHTFESVELSIAPTRWRLVDAREPRDVCQSRPSGRVGFGMSRLQRRLPADRPTEMPGARADWKSAIRETGSPRYKGRLIPASGDCLLGIPP